MAGYPIKYEPPEPGPKNAYVSPGWTPHQPEMVAWARHVLGYGGAFPPYEGLKKKLLEARDFDEAFRLRPVGSVPRW